MNKGVLSAFAAYVLWGFFPLYFKALEGVPAFQILSHRIVWSLLFVMIIVGVRGEWTAMRKTITRRTMLIYLGAGALLAVNWGTYVWAVNAGHVVETSLGYFINPLVTVLLGVIFLRERLRPVQWAPVGLAAFGVIYMAVSYGQIPWIALVLAFSFGLYGLVKKLAPLGSLHGLAMETGMIFIPALALLLFDEAAGTGAFGHLGLASTLLLAFSGVATAIPLLLFANGVRQVPLTTIGLLQFIAPTLQFLLGVLVFAEPFGPERIVGFGIIWLALIIFSAENLLNRRKQALAAA
jgi:chloramphenicol-sensitive protein RarD